MSVHMHTYIATGSCRYFPFDWKQGGLFLCPGILFLQVDQSGQAGAKQFLMARDYCPVQLDSILHDLRRLPTLRNHLNISK